MNELKPPISAGDITEPADRFHCSPYHVNIRADSCARRQAMVRVGLRRIEMEHCIDCPLGRIVERNSGGPVPRADVLRKVQGMAWRHLRLLPANREAAAALHASPPKQRRRRLRVVDGGRSA